MTYQKIYFGAPGTGKSHKIQEELKQKLITDDRIYRVTFHPEFSYSDFVGQILPKVLIDSDGERKITYEFSKGIFTQALEKAYENLTENVYLIIEEMSRGNVASVFGDIFQLLDRENIGIEKGFSKYEISNDLISKDISYTSGNKIKLPPNFIILGTVNTSDQNVFVMDTAFKRRFDWEYISVDPLKDDNDNFLNEYKIKIIDNLNQTIEIEWSKLYMKLNKFIVTKNYLDLGEDKQIGQFFIDFIDVDERDVKNIIKNKLFFYLWADINKVTFKKNISLFKSEIQSYAELNKMFEEDKCVFSELFIDLLNEA